MSKSQSIANLITIALGIFVAYHSYHVLKLGILIIPGAGFLPFLCGLALVVLGIIWRLQPLLFKSPSTAAPAAVRTEAVGEGEPAPLAVSRAKLALAFAATVIYAALFERIGFFLATLLFMLGWQVIAERQRWLKAVIITVLCTVAMYSLFRLLLHVELPSNPLLS
jgi:hypothetical protein